MKEKQCNLPGFEKQQNALSNARTAKNKAAQFLKQPRRSIRIDEKTIIQHRDMTTDPEILKTNWINKMESFRYLAEKKRGNNGSVL
jgi:hypothetical protein